MSSNNAPISGGEETVEITFCKLKKRVDCSNTRSDNMKETGFVLREFLMQNV